MADETMDLVYLDTAANYIAADYDITACQSFLVTGALLAKPISEFSAGLKVGKATYDEREHAFWLNMDDWSGGIGYHFLDIREALGTAWDNPDGVDLRFSNRALLPPEVTTLNCGTAPGAYDYSVVGPAGNRNSVTSVIDASDGKLYVGIGNKLYYTDKTRASLTACDTMPNCKRITAVFEYSEDGTATTRYLYYTGTDGSGTTLMRRAKVPIGGGSDWADCGTKCIENAIVYDKGGGNRVIVGMTPIAKLVFSTNGVDWSDDILTPPEVLYNSGIGSVDFIGAAPAPWGGSGIYFLNTGLHCLDYDSKTTYTINLGNMIRLTAGCLHQDTVVVTDGWNVYQYMPGATETVRNIGVRTKDGLPGCISSGCITALISDGDFLYAIWSLKDSRGTQLMVYTGTGWTTLGKEIDDFISFTGCAESLPITYSAVQSRRLWIIGSLEYNSVTGAGARLYFQPAHGKAPELFVDHFDAGPASFITGWIDGGFVDLKGVLLRLTVFAAGQNSYDDPDWDYFPRIQIEYRLDGDESAAWIDLGTLENLWYNPTANLFFGDYGVEFKTVQFKITLKRYGYGTDDVIISPDLRGLVLVYNKKPILRTAWTFRIDVDRMVNEKVNMVDLDVGATTEYVWRKLKTLWDERLLLVFYPPSVEVGPLKVCITDFPATFDDFREEIEGKGYIDVQLIELIGEAEHEMSNEG